MTLSCHARARSASQDPFGMKLDILFVVEAVVVLLAVALLAFPLGQPRRPGRLRRERGEGGWRSPTAQAHF